MFRLFQTDKKLEEREKEAIARLDHAIDELKGIEKNKMSIRLIKTDAEKKILELVDNLKSEEAAELLLETIRKQGKNARLS